MTDPQLLQALLDNAIDDDIHEEDAIEFIQEHDIIPMSHSRQYLINLAFNHGWRPEINSSASSKVKRNAIFI